MKSTATNVDEYIAGLPKERAVIISQLRDLIHEHIPDGYAETMNWGMICYEVPLAMYPTTYNKKPLMFAALASQKNYCSLYLMGIYCNPEYLHILKEGFSNAGKKLKMGKSCIRFQTLEDLPLDVIQKAVCTPNVEDYIKFYEATRET